MTRGLIIALMLVVIPAATQAEGVNLSWDACGSEGTYAKHFACDTNTGPGFTLYCSFVAPALATAVIGADIKLDLWTCTAVPNWWQFRNPGSCRLSAITASADFTGTDTGHCSEFWEGQAVGGLMTYETWLEYSLGRGRFTAAFARAPSTARPLEAGIEYAVVRVTLSRSNTVGEASCAGCSTPAILLLSEVHLIQPVGVGNFRLNEPAERNHVAWQTDWGTLTFFCGDPVRNTTWGAIKAQYR